MELKWKLIGWVPQFLWHDKEWRQWRSTGKWPAILQSGRRRRISPRRAMELGHD